MIPDLRAKIEQLISLYETQRQRGDELAAKLKDAEGRIAEAQQQITELKSQIDHYKLQAVFTSGPDTQASKDTLDRLIRDIDKCIKLIEK